MYFRRTQPVPPAGGRLWGGEAQAPAWEPLQAPPPCFPQGRGLGSVPSERRVCGPGGALAFLGRFVETVHVPSSGLFGNVDQTKVWRATGCPSQGSSLLDPCRASPFADGLFWLNVASFTTRPVPFLHVTPESDGDFSPSVATICSNCHIPRALGKLRSPERETKALLPYFLRVWSSARRWDAVGLGLSRRVQNSRSVSDAPGE